MENLENNPGGDFMAVPPNPGKDEDVGQPDLDREIASIKEQLKELENDPDADPDKRRALDDRLYILNGEKEKLQ